VRCDNYLVVMPRPHDGAVGEEQQTSEGARDDVVGQRTRATLTLMLWDSASALPLWKSLPQPPIRRVSPANRFTWCA